MVEKETQKTCFTMIEKKHVNKLPLYVVLQNKHAEITSPSLHDTNLHSLILLYLCFTAIYHSQ